MVTVEVEHHWSNRHTCHGGSHVASDGRTTNRSKVQKGEKVWEVRVPSK